MKRKSVSVQPDLFEQNRPGVLLVPLHKEHLAALVKTLLLEIAAALASGKVANEGHSGSLLQGDGPIWMHEIRKRKNRIAELLEERFDTFGPDSFPRRLTNNVLGDQSALLAVSSINWVFDGANLAGAFVTTNSLALLRETYGPQSGRAVGLWTSFTSAAPSRSAASARFRGA